MIVIYIFLWFKFNLSSKLHIRFLIGFSKSQIALIFIIKIINDNQKRNGNKNNSIGEKIKEKSKEEIEK